MNRERIILVGPGAMGCGVGAYLSRQGADVALLDYRPERAAQLNARGIRAEYQDSEWTSKIPVASAAEKLGPAGLVIFLVKAYATRDAARHAAACVDDRTAVLTLQNGLGNYEALADVFPPEQVLAGTIVMGCASVGPGEVLISGIGDIVLGSPFENDELTGAATALLDSYWPAVAGIDDILPAIWRKVTANAAINPLTALTGLLNGALVEDESLRETLGAIARETAAVAHATGVDAFEGEAPAGFVENVCRVTGQNRSSMLQDITGGRPTEIDQICGEIVRRGEAAGIETPLCRTMTALIRGLERRGAL